MITVGFKSDKGISRDGNEDSVFVLPDRHLYMVADGVGGHNSGELASRMAVSYMARFVALNPIQNMKTGAGLKDYFMSLFAGANEIIYNHSVNEKINRGMATTAVLCYVCEEDERAYVVNVGDSRCYLVRDGRLLQVTSDHTLVQEMVDKGMITALEAEKRSDKNMITRALGGEKKVEPDFFVFNIYPGDTIILCSDGLYEEIAPDYLASVVSEATTMYGLCGRLVAIANSNGGNDNISVICIRIQ